MENGVLSSFGIHQKKFVKHRILIKASCVPNFNFSTVQSCAAGELYYKLFK
jgi:hypothetical protein